MFLRRLKDVGFSNQEDILHSCKTSHRVVYKTFHTGCFQTPYQYSFQDNGKRQLESIFARCLLDALKMSDLQI